MPIVVRKYSIFRYFTVLLRTYVGITGVKLRIVFKRSLDAARTTHSTLLVNASFFLVHITHFSSARELQ